MNRNETPLYGQTNHTIPQVYVINYPQYPVGSLNRVLCYIIQFPYKFILPGFNFILRFFVKGANLVFEHLGHNWPPQFQSGT